MTDLRKKEWAGNIDSRREREEEGWQGAQTKSGGGKQRISAPHSQFNYAPAALLTQTQSAGWTISKMVSAYSAYCNVIPIFCIICNLFLQIR